MLRLRLMILKWMDRLDDATMELRVAELASPGTSINVHGGPARQDGQVTLGAMGAFMTSSSEYQVDRGGHLLIEDGWHDVGQGPLQSLLSGNGRVTHQGGTINSFSATSAMLLSDYHGEYSLLGIATNSYVSMDSISAAKVLVAGVFSNCGRQPVHGSELGLQRNQHSPTA